MTVPSGKASTSRRVRSERPSGASRTGTVSRA
jgi:hypothetical protein